MSRFRVVFEIQLPSSSIISDRKFKEFINANPEDNIQRMKGILSDDMGSFSNWKWRSKDMTISAIWEPDWKNNEQLRTELFLLYDKNIDDIHPIPDGLRVSKDFKVTDKMLKHALHSYLHGDGAADGWMEGEELDLYRRYQEYIHPNDTDDEDEEESDLSDSFNVEFIPRLKSIKKIS